MMVFTYRNWLLDGIRNLLDDFIWGVDWVWDLDFDLLFNLNGVLWEK